jgi:hypothetical protein
MGCLCSKEETVEEPVYEHNVGLHAPFLAVPFDRTNPIYTESPQLKRVRFTLDSHSKAPCHVVNTQ